MHVKSRSLNGPLSVQVYHVSDGYSSVNTPLARLTLHPYGHVSAAVVSTRTLCWHQAARGAVKTVPTRPTVDK